MRNIEELCNLRHRTRSSVSVHVIAIAMKSTIDGFKKLIQWCANTGVQGIRIHWLNIDRKPDQRNEVLDPETAIENLKMQVRAAAATGIAIDYPLGSFLLKLQSQINELKFVKNRAEFLSFITRKYRAQRQRTGCRMLGNTLNIDMAGNVFVCPREERMAGNLFSDTELQLKNNIHYFIKQYSRTLFPECGNCHFNSSEI
jgi:hypothetical protein